MDVQPDGHTFGWTDRHEEQFIRSTLQRSRPKNSPKLHKQFHHHDYDVGYTQTEKEKKWKRC